MTASLPLLLALLPLLGLTILLHLFQTRKIRALSSQLLNLRTREERREQEMAALETQLAQASLQRNKLAQAQVNLRQQCEQRLNSLEQDLEDLVNQPLPAPEQTVKPPAAAPPPKSALADSPLITGVLDLLSQGRSPGDIARIKGIQVGEVNLIKRLTNFSPKEPRS